MTLQQVIARLSKRFGKHRLFRAASLWPPYLAAGIRVAHVEPDLSRVDVELVELPWNRNYVGTHFGGSLFAMCDPFHMLMLIERLGPGFVVWDKASTIRFLKPGRGTVRTSFVIDDTLLGQIRADALRDGRTDVAFRCEVRDAKDVLVAEVEKVVYVRAKAPR
jgi:acyl-coenzyme A thioesterase PaaI-like protein